MTHMFKGLLVTLMVSVGLMAIETTKIQGNTDTADTHHIRVYTTDNSAGKITPKSIQKAFEKAGFMVEANNDMNGPFKRDFNNTYFDVFNLMVLWKKDTFMDLAEKYPKIGLFTPLSMSIYTRKGEKTISVSSITPSGIASMTGVPENEKALQDLGKSIENVLKTAMPGGHFETLSYKMQAPKGPLVAEATVPAGDDWEDTKDDLEMKFEGELAPNGFVSPAFVDLNYDLDEHDNDWYEFYDAYSICKIKVIYTVSKLHPEAGAFAPCTMYLYLKKGDNTIHMGFPTVHKWISAMDIKDKESIDELMDAQHRFEKILDKITGKASSKTETASKKLATVKKEVKEKSAQEK